MIRLLCVDDHALVRDGIELIISRQTDMELIGSLATGEEAIDFFRHETPDVTLMDLQLATIDGADAIKTIKKAHPDARFVVLTMLRGRRAHPSRHVLRGRNLFAEGHAIGGTR